MKDFGTKLQGVVDKLVRESSYWAQFITYNKEGILLAEVDPCSSYHLCDAAMTYKLYGVEGLPEGFHFVPVQWLETLKPTENTDKALQMRAFGKVKYE